MNPSFTALLARTLDFDFHWLVASRADFVKY